MKEIRRTENYRQRTDELHSELDSLVIEAIENIVHTSRRLHGVRQRRKIGKIQQQLETDENQSNVTRLHGKRPERRSSSMKQNQELAEELSGSDIDEVASELPGLTHKQRERAENFTEWLMQQDNYPIILQHVEELLAPFDEEDAWPDDSAFDNSGSNSEMYEASDEAGSQVSVAEDRQTGDVPDLKQAVEPDQVGQSAEVRSIGGTNPETQDPQDGQLKTPVRPLTPGQPQDSSE